MRNRRLIQSGILAAAIAVACLGAGAGMARADQITLDVSGSMSAQSGSGGSCSSSGCTLGGTIVFNNTTGAVVSVDVTMSGESPTVGPFTQNYGLFEVNGITVLTVNNGASTNFLELLFATPTAGSLVGYNGGALSTHTNALGNESQYWSLTSGSLTPATTPTPEPASLLLLGTGLFGLGLLVRRKFARVG